MKHRIRLLSLLSLLFLLPLLSGCVYLADRMQEVTLTESESEEDAGYEPPARPALYECLPEGSIVCGFPAAPAAEAPPDALLCGKSFAFVSDAVRASWRDPLIARISSAPAAARGFALFDVTMDGTPELLSLTSGLGSTTGWAQLEVLDLATGETLGILEKGLTEELALYYSTENGLFHAFAYSELRNGADTSVHLLTPLARTADGKYYTPAYLRSDYRYTLPPADPDEKDAMPIPEEVTHTRYGETLTPKEYAWEYTYFATHMIALPETRAHLILWEEITATGDAAESASAMADALLSLEQEFVKMERN